MSIEASLTYQKKFFNDFTDAWHKKSRYRLYQGLDATAENLRLDIEETPGYILAYDKNAQAELHDFLQIGLIDFLRQHIPFLKLMIKEPSTLVIGTTDASLAILTSSCEQSRSQLTNSAASYHNSKLFLTIPTII